MSNKEEERLSEAGFFKNDEGFYDRDDMSLLEGLYEEEALGVLEYAENTAAAAVEEEREKIVEWLKMKSESPDRRYLWGPQTTAVTPAAYRLALFDAAKALQKMGEDEES